MEKHFPPEYGKDEFHCVHCEVYSRQEWAKFYYYGTNRPDEDFDYCTCVHCKKRSYWYQKKMIVPSDIPVPYPHTDMPDVCIADFQEAREIAAKSPRSSAALLRLVVQKLMIVLGGKGRNINDDIASLAKKGLPQQVTKALDICRVVGNNAVHPGELSIDDSPEISYKLFELINFIIEDQITRPKSIDELFSRLPESSRKAIENRDKSERE